jgi:hypothetical protein
MNSIRHKQLKTVLLLSAVLLLRATIPAGYMPAATGSGWFVDLCPEGLPSGLMEVLGESSEHHHGHMDHGQGGSGEPGNDDHLCPIGQMLLPAAIMDNACQVEMTPLTPVPAAIPIYAYTGVFSTNTHSRDPPA